VCRIAQTGYRAASDCPPVECFKPGGYLRRSAQKSRRQATQDRNYHDNLTGDGSRPTRVGNKQTRETAGNRHSDGRNGPTHIDGCHVLMVMHVPASMMTVPGWPALARRGLEPKDDISGLSPVFPLQERLVVLAVGAHGVDYRFPLDHGHSQRLI
jgi:hypothetical protein